MPFFLPQKPWPAVPLPPALCIAVQYVLLFLVLTVNSDQFQILWNYTLLLKPPILACDNTPPQSKVGRGLKC